MTARTKFNAAATIICFLLSIFIFSFPASAENVTTWAAMNSATAADLADIWGSSGSDVFAVGSSGTILHYNGTAWSAMSSGSTANLADIWGTNSSNVFAVGSSGTILHYDGTAWSVISSGATADLADIWGASSSDIFAVGSSGTILHYDGTDWSIISSGTTANLAGIWGSSGSDVFVAGSSGTILHYDGDTWETLSSGTTTDLADIWGASHSEVFAAGNSGTILYYDGTTWSVINSGTAADLTGIWGSSGSDVFTVGSAGTILHYDGYTFSPMRRDTIVNLHSVWGFSSTDVFTAGKSGTILHYAPPVISSISPNRGNQGETLDVTITGKNLGQTLGVNIGTGIAINNLSVLNSTQVKINITVVAGAATGARDISITTPAGTYTLPGGFTVIQALPVIMSITPDHGNQATTLDVTLTGDNLAETTALQFGTGITVNRFTALDDNRIAANITIASDAPTGARDISVTTPGGSYTLPDIFTVVQALPGITAVSPAQASQGTTLDITFEGTHFDSVSEISMGTDITVNTFNVLSANQVTANITIAPDAAVGTRDVSITTPGGSYTLANGFTIKQALPSIVSIEPNQGNQATTLNITIFGTHLTGTSEVQMGIGITVHGFTVLNDNQITANITIAAEATTGGRNVYVSTPGGSYTLPNSFSIKQALPIIDGVSPDKGNQGATLNITITGANLIGTNEVRLGTGVAVNSYTVISANQITANITIIAGTEAGYRDVSVVTPGGSYTLSNGFTVKYGLPVITSISPGQGNCGDAITVIISGSNLDGATSVSFGTDVTVQSFSNLSPTQLSVSILIDNEATTGARDITVTTPGGKTTLSNHFSIKDKSLGTLVIASIWTGVVIVVVLFIFILNTLRQKRRARF